MSTLADHVRVAARYARSANLERDAQAEDALDGYLLTGRVLEMLDRVVSAAAGVCGGTWSITGPYGSGKSSLGVFLDALFGPRASAAFGTAHQLVARLDADLAERIVGVRASHDVAGFARGLVTAHTEPVTHTVTRALDRAVQQWFGRTPTARQFPAITLLSAALDDVRTADPRRTGPAPGSVVEIATALATRVPLLIVIDEFGKNLEAAQQRSDADLYLLQLLAEAAHTRRGAPLFLITMQHLAFGEYAASADTTQQREWAKIQGRFDDVVFVDSAEQTRRLIARAFAVADPLTAAVQAWAADQARTMADLNLYEVADVDLLAECYPLHPLVLAVLPELCRRYGQNERTMFSFLTGASVRAAPALLRGLELVEPLPTISLADVYDFFVESSSTAVAAGATRWSEISTRLRDLGTVNPNQLVVAKTVAVLNLLATTGPQRASRRAILAADPHAATHLAALEADGVVVYRDSTDEYRVWQGTGIDVGSLIEGGRAAARQRVPVALLSAAAPLEPIVATGHSMRTDTLRTFERCYVTDPAGIDALPAGSVYDGRVYMALDPEIELPASAPAGLPIVVQVPTDVTELIAAAVEVHVLQLALREPTVIADWVARTELNERLVAATTSLTAVLDAAANEGRWYLLTEDGPAALESRNSSLALSEAADRSYSKTVAIRNETLNRVELSSQGAKARRLLLLAMLEHEDSERLGLDGHGPEVAMYAAMLGHSGVHSYDDRRGRWAIRPPKQDPLMHHAWRIIETEMRSATDRRISLGDIHASLQLPPVGMKAGAIPVLVTAVLIATSDEVAVYEHGTFRPVLTDEVCDRMVRNPGHFEIKYYANAAGARRTVIENLAEALALTPRYRRQRVSNVLAVVSELVAIASRLPPYTLHATNLSDCAIAVRDAITSATEPDTLLFQTLPTVIGLKPIGARLPKWAHTTAFTAQLTKALDELRYHYRSTVLELEQELYRQAREPGRRELAAQAQVIEREIINPDLRSFVLALAADAFDDESWIENIATVITRTAPRHWKMDDHRRFSSELAGKLASFRRLLVLHSEARGLDAQPFAAHRFTFTASTGDEDAVLVALDDHQRMLLAEHLASPVDELASVFGTAERAERALLAWVAERVFPHVLTPVGHNGLEPLTKAANDG